jgi:hypothetical protein
MSTASTNVEAANAAMRKGNALRALGCLVLLSGALSGLLLLGAWLLRDVLAGQVVEASLREHGVVCDEISIRSTATLGEFTLAPTSCALSEGTISRVTWRDPIVLERGGLGISSVHATHLVVTRAPRPTDARAEAWGMLGGMLHGPEQVGAVLIFASRMSRLESSPSLQVDSLEVVVEGGQRPEMTLVDLRVAERDEGPVEAHVQSITLAPMVGLMGLSIQPSVNDVTLHAEPTTGVIAGNLEAGPRLPMLGTLSLRRHVEVVGERLDQEIPHWRLR